MFGAARVEPRDGLPFASAFHDVALGRIGLTRAQHGCSLELGTSGGDLFALMVPQEGRHEIRVRDRALPHVAGERAVLLSPGTEATSVTAAGYEGTVVSVPRAVLEHEADALFDRREAPLRFEPSIDLRDGAGAELARLVAFLVREAEHTGGALASPPIAGDLGDALLHLLLLRLPHSRRDRLDVITRPAEPSYLRRAEEYLAAHADRSVSSAELAAAMGCSVRALQLAFRKHRGCSPSEFVRERRLELARDRLLAWRHATVTDVALACGFAHLGRFSGEYRARFGESPSETRRQGDN